MKKSLADRIEQYLKVLIERSEEKQIEIQRAELAETFCCVPSQVTYVIGTRFTEREGYTTESRRGGKGYVRITRYAVHGDIESIMDRNNLFDFMNDLKNNRMISGREYDLIKHIMLSATQDWPEDHKRQFYNSVGRAIAEYLNLI